MNASGGFKPPATPEFVMPAPIDTPEEAIKFAEFLVTECEKSRLGCDMYVPEGGETGAINQMKLQWVFLIRHGAALGGLGTLLRLGKIGPIAYNALVERVRATLNPKLVGTL